jgi:hypothetical protein
MPYEHHVEFLNVKTGLIAWLWKVNEVVARNVSKRYRGNWPLHRDDVTFENCEMLQYNRRYCLVSSIKFPSPKKFV